jgi:cysteinyl-tRNA synthetase
MSRAIETLTPVEPGCMKVYCCGPTVYDVAHIGNLRKYVCDDVLIRVLRHAGYDVTHVMNVTDVDDKIIRAAPGGLDAIRAYAAPFTRAFFEDCATLRIKNPDIVCAATDHVDDMVALVERLIERGHAYQSDGSWYFRVESFPDYGKLTHLDMEGMKPGARVEVDEYDKDDVRDFALWKAHKEGEVCWETRLGPGRPGWHIECSAMSMRYLGETFDIHTGGVDNCFPHHENELAQSEGATGKTFVNHWVHHEHLLMDSEKMAKSLGNIATLRDLIAAGHDPRAIRYLLASAHNRTQLNFTGEAMAQAAQTVKGLHEFLRRLDEASLPAGAAGALADAAAQAGERFFAALYSDLQMPQALSHLFDLVKRTNIALGARSCSLRDVEAVRGTLDECDEVLAVLDYDDNGHLDAEVEELIQRREEARRSRKWSEADAIRGELLTAGIVLEDTPDGTRWKRA